MVVAHHLVAVRTKVLLHSHLNTRIYNTLIDKRYLPDDTNLINKNDKPFVKLTCTYYLNRYVILEYIYLSEFIMDRY